MTLPNRFKVSFRVPGSPLPKQSFRARNSRKGYTDPRIKAHQDAIGYAAKEAMKGNPPFDGEVTVSYVFRRSDRRRVDIDNLAKCVSDAIKEIIIEDDCLITAAHLYIERGCNHPETVILVEAL